MKTWLTASIKHSYWLALAFVAWKIRIGSIVAFSYAMTVCVSCVTCACVLLFLFYVIFLRLLRFLCTFYFACVFFLRKTLRALRALRAFEWKPDLTRWSVLWLQRCKMRVSCLFVACSRTAVVRVWPRPEGICHICHYVFIFLHGIVKWHTMTPTCVFEPTDFSYSEISWTLSNYGT